MSEFLCQALEKHHDRAAFNCGVEELDRYLRERASQDARRRIAAVFVMVPEQNHQQIAGYYTLASGSVNLRDLPESLIKKLPRYPNVPAIVLGRLARDVNFPGVGKLLLIDALARALQHTTEVGAAIVLVDAKNDSARSFYERFGFRCVSDRNRRLYLPMKTIEQLFSEY